MKKLLFVLILACAVTGLDAKRKDYTDRNDPWRHKKYFNISWVNQTLSDPQNPDSMMKSDFGVSLANGRTYYLHREPIFGIMKFGFDWTKIDLNYARYTDGSLFDYKPAMTKSDGFDDIVTEDNPLTSIITGDWGKNQIDLSMHFGASLTINPVDFLKINGYMRFAPTLSGLLAKGAGDDMEDMTFYGGYGSFWVGGAAISYKVISLGVETRWGTTTYRNFNFDGEEDANGKTPLLGDMRYPLKTNSTRIYLSFRF